MEDRVKGTRTPKKATAPEETGQKPGELLLAVLEELKANREELKANREESAALRELLARVLATVTGQQEAEESPARQVRQEESTPSQASRQVNGSSGPLAIRFVDRREGQERQRGARR